ncbi:elongation factor P 5-aminopentanone reductase [Fictibacillus barbaricus]|uniref:3-oxoacyl-[acyl-carrier protein] reductase n=1 Tax=Fictibacillus barbaricus TaxID=182136 RepID=A0ABU1TYB6_9BACL|nr:SDR family NAD(P)-dependent oxidoreductase [Fictibacillus barbaricus]MDR7072210.1 3-oxoacyl-[acyl-carrier protein] reductase [Fictibacillus barbaricus]
MKTALVTGATGAIGTEICRMLAEQGYFLYIHFHKNDEKAKKLQKDLFHSFHVKSVIIHADLSKEDGPKKLLNKLTKNVDVFIYNCGNTQYGLLTDFTNESIRETMQLHLLSAIEITKTLSKSMIQQKSGKIIMISSVWGEVGAACETVYSAAKGGLNTFVKALAKELAPSGINVNSIAPGVIETPMLDQFSEEEKDELASDIPAGRFGQPQEVAHAAEYLISEKSAYISGHILSVNGSWFT